MGFCICLCDNAALHGNKLQLHNDGNNSSGRRFNTGFPFFPLKKYLRDPYMSFFDICLCACVYVYMCVCFNPKEYITFSITSVKKHKYVSVFSFLAVKCIMLYCAILLDTVQIVILNAETSPRRLIVPNFIQQRENKSKHADAKRRNELSSNGFIPHGALISTSKSHTWINMKRHNNNIHDKLYF